MKLKTKILNGLLVLLSIYSFGQNKNSNENIVPILPHWEINDVHTFKIKFFQEEVMEKKLTKNVVNFSASFKVLEKNEKDYILVWTFNTAKMVEGTPDKEALIISKLLGTEILIKFSKYGQYVEIVNDETIRLSATKVIDELIVKERNSKEKLDLNVTKQLITTKEGLEFALLNSIKTYFLPFGLQYPLDQEMTYNLKYPNLFGGNKPFDAFEKVRLRIPENSGDICVIESNQIIDTRQFLVDYRFFLKKKFKHILDKDIETFIRKHKVGIKQNFTHHFDLKKGLLLQLTFKKIIDLGILTTTFGYEVEQVN